MDKSLRSLCDALKKIFLQLKHQNNALSFILLTGRDNQGKSTLLRQSNFEHIVIDCDRQASVYYNKHGVIVELNESWLNQNKNLLQYTLKQLNSCHRSYKISGIILCIDIQDLLNVEPLEFVEKSKAHTLLLKRFGQSLNYRVDTAIIFSKLDALAGFCEFFQDDHATDLVKPLGFSLDWSTRDGKYLNNFTAQFDQFIEALGQQVIRKIHPARSSLKRTLIREFPLQLASLNPAIRALIQTISPKLFRVQALYFTSGEQGGMSLDCLNKKIKHEYALTLQDRFPQSTNHRAYFIQGALIAFQTQTKRQAARISAPNKWLTGLIAGLFCISVSWIGAQYLKSSQSLDKVSKELIAYDVFAANKKVDPTALYHLSKASSTIEKLSSNTVYHPMIQQLKTTLQIHTKQNLHGNFLPSLLSEIEETMLDTRQSQSARYAALKIYLMLGDPTLFSEAEVLGWFRTHWQTALPKATLDKKLVLLKETLRQPLQPIPVNRQIISDVRNYMNALPPSYLYYNLAKDSLSNEKLPIMIEGFELAENNIPVYFTKSHFNQVIDKLPLIAAQLQTDNWVLARQDLAELPALLKQAYCYEYVVWWQNFMRKSTPQHAQDYKQARQITQALRQSDAFIKLVSLIQKHTSPELNGNATLFNEEIASKFTELSLMSRSAVRDVTRNLTELEKFLSTLSVVNDQGRTAFNMVKARFEGDTLSNPLSALYADVRQLPDPVSTWTKQIADDSWYLFINEARNYINQQWQQLVIRDYQYTIAKRFPFDANQTQEVNIADFDHFFATHGTLNSFIEQYLKPFLDTSQAQWQLKEINNYVLPISADMINELIRANVISNMFFPDHAETSKITFSLQKLSLDPIIASLQLTLGNKKLYDSQDSEALVQFIWPVTNAQLSIHSIEGHHYELEEFGPWAFFKMLQKVNVLADEQDSSNLQILFEVNGNSGRYVLRTDNKVNPFIPGILNGFTLSESIA